MAQVPDGAPVYIAPQNIMDEVAGFPVHRGVLACGLKGNAQTASALLAALNPTPQDTERTKTVLCLIGLSNHDNVGACFRNAAAFGADAVLLDGASCDPLYRKSIRVSAGAALTLPFAYGQTELDLIDSLKASGFEIWCLTPRADAAPINTLNRPQKLALILGAEGPGLSENMLNTGTKVRLQMADGFDSLNVATAGAIAMSAVFEASSTR